MVEPDCVGVWEMQSLASRLWCTVRSIHARGHTGSEGVLVSHAFSLELLRIDQTLLCSHLTGSFV